MSGRKLARRACDGCKIRKIKCSETSPCDGCRSANIPCTWLKQAQPRGPRRLRDATLQEIRKAQDILQNQSREAARKGNSKSQNVNDPDPPPQPSSEVAQVVLYLCVYRVQLYPIWPIIKVERLIASLQSANPDVEVFALAYALAAATATRTQSTDLSISKRNHAQILERKCQAARAKVPQGRPPNLTTVRIAFFLHIYYESLEANSMKSMLYLREAVTIATMIGLHKEAYYVDVPAQEREIRRRVLWLLFITERVISILYEQPITLRTRIELPSTADTDEVDVLVGFQLLAKLFWKLDDAGMFGLLDELDVQASPSSTGASGSSVPPTNYANVIQEDASYDGYISSVQNLDLTVTRCWMQVMNLRIQQMSPASIKDEEQFSLVILLSTVEKVVQIIEQSPRGLIEALGFAFQLKLSTISGILQEFLSTTSRFHCYFDPDTYQNCATLSNKLQLIFVQKAHNPEGSSPSITTSFFQNTFENVTNIPSPKRYVPQHSAQSNTSSPRTGGSMPSPNQDFAVTNNYEGLFQAVEMAGVQSSDSIEDLFNQSSLEHYSTFDDEWPDIGTMDPTTTIPYHWQTQHPSFNV